LVQAPAKGTANPAVRAKFPPLVIGKTTGAFESRLNASGETFRMSFRRIEPDQPDFAALHRINSRPAGLPSSHSRSSLLRRALGLH
jgi:hypothetical protein